MPSAIGWSRPAGPTRLGPIRSWIQAETRRSTQVMKVTAPITSPIRKATFTADSISSGRNPVATPSPSGLGRVEADAQLADIRRVEAGEGGDAGGRDPERLSEARRSGTPSQAGRDLRERLPGGIALLIRKQPRPEKLNPSLEVDDASVHLTEGADGKRQVGGPHGGGHLPVERQQKVQRAQRLGRRFPPLAD